MVSWPRRPATRAVRLCPDGGVVAVEKRWDQPGWFVTCTEHGTVAAGLDSMADASRCAADHEAGTAPGLHG